MAKPPPQKPAATPDDFPQVEPQELFPSNNIRFVMWETAKLTERVEALTKSTDGLGPSLEKALDKHAADMKERIAEIRADVKESDKKLGDLKESIDSFKGAMKVLGGVYALALVLVATFLTWFLRPVPALISPPVGAPVQGTALPSNDSAPVVRPKR